MIFERGCGRTRVFILERRLRTGAKGMQTSKRARMFAQLGSHDKLTMHVRQGTGHIATVGTVADTEAPYNPNSPRNSPGPWRGVSPSNSEFRSSTVRKSCAYFIRVLKVEKGSFQSSAASRHSRPRCSSRDFQSPRARLPSRLVSGQGERRKRACAPPSRTF
jgi:hypothetical protein